MSRFHRIDINQSGNHLRQGLRDRTGNAGWCCCPCLPCRQQQNWHAVMHRLFHHQTGFSGKPKWRHDKAIAVRHERTRPPFIFATSNAMQHFKNWFHKFSFGKADANMFCCSFDRRIDRIEIQISRIGNIARNHRTLKEMDIIHLLNNPRSIINIGKVGFAIFILGNINNMNRRTRRAIMHTRP